MNQKLKWKIHPIECEENWPFYLRLYRYDEVYIFIYTCLVRKLTFLSIYICYKQQTSRNSSLPPIIFEMYDSCQLPVRNVISERCCAASPDQFSDKNPHMNTFLHTLALWKIIWEQAFYTWLTELSLYMDNNEKNNWWRLCSIILLWFPLVQRYDSGC